MKDEDGGARSKVIDGRQEERSSKVALASVKEEEQLSAHRRELRRGLRVELDYYASHDSRLVTVSALALIQLTAVSAAFVLLLCLSLLDEKIEHCRSK